jgi:hypothetical protein
LGTIYIDRDGEPDSYTEGVVIGNGMITLYLKWVQQPTILPFRNREFMMSQSVSAIRIGTRTVSHLP